MYQIKCDDYILYDPRDEELILLNPKCKLEANTVGEGAFTILQNHPYYDKLQKLKSIFEIRQGDDVIFRGRMTNDSRDFYNRLDVDLEGVLGFANDSIIEPFNFPEDFPNATEAENIVEYFFDWILAQHNAQVETWQRLKPGTVTVTDPNNYITRASSNNDTTWNTLKTKLVDIMGGYLIIRYEDDGNYVDYVDDFELTNMQEITLGENLLDMTSQSDATATYSAILPIGAEIEVESDGVDENGETIKVVTKKKVTLEDLPDGDLTEDFVKQGKYIYSKSAVAKFGWICVPPAESLWDDVTEATNLRRKAMEHLGVEAMLFSDTIEIKAVDLSFTDDQIQSFRIYGYILVNSPAHGLENKSLKLTKLDLDIQNPQNTIITIGETVRSFVSGSSQKEHDTIQKVEDVKNELSNKIEGIDGIYFYIKYSAFEDGHAMTDEPTAETKYMGVCSTNKPTAPTDPKGYTWSKSRGDDGKSVHVIYEQYYLSTSKERQEGGEWSRKPPTWSYGKYIWTRSVIVYTNPEELVYTTPVCDSSWEAVNEVQVGTRNYVINGNFSATVERGETSKHPNVYPKDWGGFNGGIQNPETSYHAHVDTETFGFNVGEFNESDGNRNWKAFSQNVKSRLEAGKNYRMSIDVYATATGTKLNGGFHYYKIGGTTQGFHSGQFSIPSGLISVNEWSRVSVAIPYPEDIDLSKNVTFYIYGYNFASNAILYVKNVSLNTSTNTTDWTPAPEDVQGQIDTSIKNVDVEYYQSAKQDELVGGEWKTDAPEWKNGKFMWSRTKTTLQDGTVSYKPSANGTCIAGSKNVDSDLSGIRSSHIGLSTQYYKTEEQVGQIASKEYVEQSEYGTFKETTESDFKQTAEAITANFNTTTEMINEVDGELQRKINEDKSYIRLSGDGIEIGKVGNAIKLVLDNDRISFKKNGLEIAWWDGENDVFHTGDIEVDVNERAKLGNFAFVPRGNGSLSFLKVGG